MLDPVLVEGQVHGGIAQGVGQALWEEAVFERRLRPAPDRLVHGLRHAARRRPADVRTASHPVPCTTNPLGVKGTGEAGTTGALAAVMNAIAHAIPNGAADHMEVPATPAKVWEACRRAMASSAK